MYYAWQVIILIYEIRTKIDSNYSMPQVILTPRVSASEQANFNCFKNRKEKIKFEIISLFGSGSSMGDIKEGS